MGLTTDGMSPADLAAVTGNNNGAFGEGNGAWWIIILFLFIFCGWGNGNGWNNGGGGVADNYVLASDFATLQRQIDSGISSLERKGDAINSGICDGFYAMNTSLLNGFAGTNSTIQQNGYDTRNAIQQGQIADMQSFNALQAQLAQCCCDNKQAIAGVNYNMAMNTNAIQQEVTNGFCQTNFNNADGLSEAFKGADALALISMPFVGAKRQKAHKNAIDAAKAAGVKQIIYTSLVNADDETNPSVEKKDHIYTENYIKEVGLDYQFMRNSQYAEAMVTNYFTYVKMGTPLTNSQGDGLMAYISRKDCAKAVAYALHRSGEFTQKVWDINGPELMTITQFIEIGNESTGNNLTFQNVTDEENYQIWDAMGVPRTTDGVFLEDSEAPFSSDGMVTFAQAIREGKMDIFTDDFKKLTGDDPITVKYMFDHNEDFQIGARHSKDD